MLERTFYMIQYHLGITSWFEIFRCAMCVGFWCITPTEEGPEKCEI